MGEQNKYKRERVRPIQRGGIQVKESAQIFTEMGTDKTLRYRGRVQSGVSEGKRTKVRV